jgi:sec-independent protein translocase protein TatA
MFGGFGVWEILLLVLVLLLFFGSARIPGIARGIGQGIRNLKHGMKDPDRLQDGEPDDDERGPDPR